MPILENPRHEAFAQARARGASLSDAYEDAGYAPGHRHAARLAETESVAARIAELRALLPGEQEAGVQAVIAALTRIARVNEEIATPEASKEARLALLDVARLRVEQEARRQFDRPYEWSKG